MVAYYIIFCAVAVVALALYLWKRSQKHNSSEPLLSQASFTMECLERLRQEYPQYHFTMAPNLALRGHLGDHSFEIFTDNSYRQYLQHPENKSTLIAKLTIMPHMSNIQQHSNPETADILPIIRNVKYAADLMEKLAASSTSTHLALAQYNSDLAIIYVLDTAEQFRYLTIEELPALGLDIHTIHTISLNNLRKKLKQVKITQLRTGLYSLKCDNTYESSFILLEECWSKENFPIENLIMTVSNRNLLLVTGFENKELLQPLMETALKCYNTESYPISPLLYQQKAGKFERMETMSVSV
ncbi:DUF1444 family protein [Chitinophaga sp. Hz27]|uniref:DUF1444 family protein n=1 Tax=Chitinophaga sp. Hz27 TaxID=3347169 RepID=UPI0035DC69F6